MHQAGKSRFVRDLRETAGDLDLIPAMADPKDLFALLQSSSRAVLTVEPLAPAA